MRKSRSDGYKWGEVKLFYLKRDPLLDEINTPNFIKILKKIKKELF